MSLRFLECIINPQILRIIGDYVSETSRIDLGYGKSLSLSVFNDYIKLLLQMSYEQEQNRIIMLNNLLEVIKNIGYYLGKSETYSDNIDYILIKKIYRSIHFQLFTYESSNDRSKSTKYSDNPSLYDALNKCSYQINNIMLIELYLYPDRIDSIIINNKNIAVYQAVLSTISTLKLRESEIQIILQNIMSNILLIDRNLGQYSMENFLKKYLKLSDKCKFQAAIEMIVKISHKIKHKTLINVTEHLFVECSEALGMDGKYYCENYDNNLNKVLSKKPEMIFDVLKTMYNIYNNI